MGRSLNAHPPHPRTPHDLAGFHELEDQVQASWMPQALACIAAHLVTELSGVATRLAARSGLQLVGGTPSDTPGDVLTKALSDIQLIQDRRRNS